jgi:hypothetical protein
VGYFDRISEEHTSNITNAKTFVTAGVSNAVLGSFKSDPSNRRALLYGIIPDSKVALSLCMRPKYAALNAFTVWVVVQSSVPLYPLMIHGTKSRHPSNSLFNVKDSCTLSLKFTKDRTWPIDPIGLFVGWGVFDFRTALSCFSSAWTASK